MAIAARAAMAHPHPGGIVVRPDGTIVAGDILGDRLLVIEPTGKWRAITGVGHVRGLAAAADGTTYGVSWGEGGGVWKLGADDQLMPVVDVFNGLFELGERDSLLLAPVDELGQADSLVIRSPSGQQSELASLADIQAVARHEATILVAAGSSIYSIDVDGNLRTLAEDVGSGLYGLTMGPAGPVVAVHDQRQVMEIAADGARRVLLQSEPPWAPTGVAIHEGVLYVVELAKHPCCWKGPRIQKVVAGEVPTTMLTIDDANHVHISPGERPLEWMLGVGSLATAGLVGGLAIVRRKIRRSKSQERGP